MQKQAFTNLLCDVLKDSLFDVINESPDVPTASLIIENGDIFIELMDGSKFRITIEPTDRFI